MVAKQHHFVHWTYLVLFSIVALSALLNQYKLMDEEEDLNHKEWTREQRWVLTVAIVSSFLSVFACVFHVAMEDFTGSNMEIGMIVVVLAMWCAGLPKLMDAEEFFAVTPVTWSGIVFNFPTIANANLFFSSWGALIVSLYLAVRQFEIYAKRENDKYLYKWAGLGAAGLVVLSDTARLFKNSNCSDVDDDETCNRTIFGIVLGAITFVFGGTSAMVNMSPLLSELSASAFVVAWCFAVAYLTFNEGPALQVGTLYFAIWAALMFALNMAVPAVFHLFIKEDETTNAQDTVTSEEGRTKDVPASGGHKVGDEAEEEEEVATGDV